MYEDRRSQGTLPSPKASFSDTKSIFPSHSISFSSALGVLCEGLLNDH